MIEGRCACGACGYRCDVAPMIVHCCHCSWCQRESGSAFVINAVVETSALAVEGAPELVMTPSASGRGQEIARCPACRVALWSHYPNAGRRAAFLRVGATRAPGELTPDVHIFTSTKLPWVRLPDGAAAFAGFYSNPGAVWRPEARARWAALMAG